MTGAVLGGLAAKVRKCRAVCLDTPDLVLVEGDWREIADAIVGCGRMPFPSVDGNPPVDRKRPFLDLRRINAESGDPSSSG